MQTHLKIPSARELILRSSGVLLMGALVGACSGPSSEPEAFGEITQALNVCSETVPTERFVDGLPAYKQCDSTNAAIWSNNGVDTSATSQGADWVLTQYSGGYQCTEWAWRYMHFKWKVDYRSGNAGSWCDGKLPAGLTKSTVPVHGDLIVFAPGSCGADSTTGHIAVVDVVNTAASSVTLVEQNNAGRRNSKISCALCFLHAVANDGANNGGAGGGAGTGGSTGAGAGSTGGSPAVPGGGRGGAGGNATSGGSPSLPGGGAATAGSTFAGASSGGVPSASGATMGGAQPIGSGASAGTGGAAAGAAAPSAALGPDVQDSAGCSIGAGAENPASRGLLFPFGLLLAGILARRSMLRRKADSPST